MAKRIVFEELFVFENDDYILINKPPHISSLDERDLTRESIISLAKAHDPELQLCHRLDKDTSGIMAIAKHPEAYRNLSMQFENREVDKIYHAIVDGVHDFTDRVVDLPISENSKGSVRIDFNLGKFAETTFNSVEAFKKHTLVACAPVTGRMHQIRIHLSSLKAPITADTTYGGKMPFLSEIKRKMNLKKFTEEQPLIKRFALHAFQISFKGLDGEMITQQADYPKDIRALLNQLSKNT